jgi:hypothetical protein
MEESGVWEKSLGVGKELGCVWIDCFFVFVVNKAV